MVVARETLGLLSDIRGLVQVVADALGAFSPEDITRWRGLLRTDGSMSSGDARRMAIWQDLERAAANRLPVQQPASKAPTKARSKGTKRKRATPGEGPPTERKRAPAVRKAKAEAEERWTARELKDVRLGEERSLLYGVLARRWVDDEFRAVQP
jgi:hypothetical protein